MQKTSIKLFAICARSLPLIEANLEATMARNTIMKRLIVTTAFVVVFSTSISVANATENKCKGDAVHATLPVVNHPTHIRNVVWRNTRFMCLQQLSDASKTPEKVSQPK